MELPELNILRADQLRDLGIPEPWSFGLIDRVRFGEIDALAHVNHTAYLQWFESLRVHWFADRGLSSYGPGDPRIVLRAITVEYLQEMKLNEPYVVATRASSFRTTSFTLEYGVFANSTLRATGNAVCVLLNPDTGQKLPLTEAQRQMFIDTDGAQPG